MSDKDPFAEPADTERTIIRPNPGGRRPSIPAEQAASAARGPQPVPTAAPAAAPVSGGALQASLTGTNPLTANAATLFSLISRIRNRAQHLDPAELRRSVISEIRSFEKRALGAGVDPQQIKIARYAICATTDDVVLNTPWGSQSSWAQQSMVDTFHKETVSGDRFYDLLARLEEDPAGNLWLLEFFYMCLALGFEGRLRVEEGGRQKADDIRAGLAGIIAGQRGAPNPEVSPKWEGVDRPFRPVALWKPVWISVAVLAVILSLTFGGLSYALSLSTQRLSGQFEGIDPGTTATLFRRAPEFVMPPIEEEEVQLDEVKSFLPDEIEAGLVSVFQNANTITVRINGSGMFASASDRLNPEFSETMARVGRALNNTTGPVFIVGHSDSDPIRNARFPDNMALSLARATSVKAKLSDLVEDPSRLAAEGRADKEPIASNETREGKATNRRIEVLIVREQEQP
jgi:type VI secretion system protein ImpK